jgi:asparagine synthase (glutamine-hydrolysing)
MCGIVGVVCAEREARERAVAMNACIVHRGPDEDGSWGDGRDALAMRRLSIIDLAGGHQPMVAPSGTVLVFNGEIYNYRQLRAELRDAWDFRTDSDTEVVLALYETEGIGALERLAGMFAFALLDRGRRRLHLVRDRLGKKPLYYTASGELLFASELKALLAGLPQRPALDHQALYDYLSLRYVPAPATPFAGIRKLRPGERLELDLDSGERSFEEWWRLEVVSGDGPAPDAPAEFEQLFLEAVEKRLVAADVPVGVMLSGGLDSSAVAAAAVELGHRDFHTFSVGFADGGAFSELAYAREVAARIGSRHHEVTIDREGFLAAVPELVWQTDEPLADLSAIPLHALARVAREDVKVVLSGEGADEILGGYDIEMLARRLDRLARLRRVPRPLVGAAAALAPAGRAEALRDLATSGWSSLLAARRAHITWVFDEGAKSAFWRGPDVRPTEDLLDAWYAEAASSDPLDQLLEVYSRSWLPEDLLMKADKATMAASLELRTPFLDHRLVEWAGRLPQRWKVGSRRDGWVSKRILREFARSRLPGSVIARPKQGFPVPAYGWLADGLDAWALTRLTGPDARAVELVDPAASQRVVERAARGDAAAAHGAWGLLVLEEWLRRWT